MPRTIREIALEIRADWKSPYFGAVPYIEAMLSMSSPNESYGADSGKGILHYFLANAGTWRGPVARKVKAEIKEMIK